MRTLTLDGKVLEAVTGSHDEALRLIEERFGVRITARGGEVILDAPGERGDEREKRVADLLEQLEELHARGVALGREDLRTAVRLLEREPATRLSEHFVDARLRPSAKKTVVPKSSNQRRYIESIRRNDLVFGIGPAGTGKTYLAVAMAVSLLNERRIQRILLARPAVEAGERLGFLPGDIAAKVDPYLRPLYDALYDMLEPDRAEKLMERGTVEVAPLAFMRGRTLNDAFVILDEAQNTTSEQMKMFLTRIGFHSKAVVTGDVTQIDLPAPKVSGLVEAQRIVGGIPGIDVVRFDETDVVRHPLVQRIILAYERHESARRAAANKGPGATGGPPDTERGGGSR
jgi:phosphate starvation-inducible protein PhoH and related proteins